MILQIQETKAFNNLPGLSQALILKRVNRLQIEDAIIIARTIGVENWKKQTGLQGRWQSIVVEVLQNEESRKVKVE